MVDPKHMKLLGSPLGHANTVDARVNDKIKMLEWMGTGTGISTLMM